MKSPHSTSVIISTYNNPKWLEKTLWGYENQTYKDFDIIIADDGSGEETKRLIDQFIQNSPLKITHVWQPDNGFQKCKILNKAIIESKADYLIFTDQDCIPRKDFIQQHVNNRGTGYYISAGYLKLPLSISEEIKREDVISGNVFNIAWLRSRNLKRTFKEIKLTTSKNFAQFMNTITPTKASWNGCNASCWRSDAIEVNGFNERMLYGAEDREFGDRLIFSGCKSKQLRYTCICVHLDHARPYKSKEIKAANVSIWKETIKNKTIKTPDGIIKSNLLLQNK